MENEMSSPQDTEDDLENSDCTLDANKGLPREGCPIISIVRGDSFWPNLIKIENSEKALHILKQLRTRKTAIEKNEIPYRVLNHWDSLNLIECDRESSKGWRRFNLIEGLWISVIKKGRELGLSLDKIAKAKPYFFENIYPNSQSRSILGEGGF